VAGFAAPAFSETRPHLMHQPCPPHLRASPAMLLRLTPAVAAEVQELTMLERTFLGKLADMNSGRWVVLQMH